MVKPVSKTKRLMYFILALLITLSILALILKVANPLPDREGFPPDPPIVHNESEFGDTIREITAGRGTKNGLYTLPTGLDAFSMRLALVRESKSTIDAQYYIWEGDLSGKMLLAEIIAAADRGVRVRLLIDDNPTAGLDGMWAAATSHPNIAVRIFNPLTIRGFRPANYLFDFPRLNRRMHNKSFTVDGAATVVGGRNVGNVYFGVEEEGLFIDLDALAVGPVVNEVAEHFDIYWNSDAAFAAETILADAKQGSLEVLRQPDYKDSQTAQQYQAAAEKTISLLDISDPDEFFDWADVQLVIDDPKKASGNAEESELLAAQIAPLIEGAKSRVDLVSGYFVPGDFGTDLLSKVAKNDVAVRAVTNSIQVTDVPVVHAGYAPFRRPLLEAGVKLYEARPLAGTGGANAGSNSGSGSGSGSDSSSGAEPAAQKKELGQTRFSGGGESVHAKTFAIDDRLFFIGSFNLDPRSAELNCEMGFVIDSPTMAIAFNSQVDERLKQQAYAVSLNKDGDMQWAEDNQGKVTVHDKEPGTNAFERGMVWFLSILPIKWML